MIQLTDKALEQVERIIAQEGIATPQLRIGVKGGGCSGLS
ncbi:iron-sulfur cluster assembly accessory protein, partial [Candidatus Parcubacteria bacterium]